MARKATETAEAASNSADVQQRSADAAAAHNAEAGSALSGTVETAAAVAAVDAAQAADAAKRAEANTSTALATREDAAFAIVGGNAVKIKRRVTLPVLPFADGMTIICKIMTPIVEGKDIKEGSRGKAKMAPARLMTIEGYTGEQRTLIANTVLEKELEEAYPNQSYVGCWFQLTRIAPRPGRDYATFMIIEIEDPRSTQAAAAD